jgi:hypothetical protein
MNAASLLAAAAAAAPPGSSPPADPTAALLPLLWHQWLVSGGAPGGAGAAGAMPPLAGAAFHRSALAQHPTLFRPVARHATAATWGMVKSASMPELGEGRMEWTEGEADDEVPLRRLPGRPPLSGSPRAVATAAEGGAEGEPGGGAGGKGSGSELGLAPIDEAELPPQAAAAAA